MFRLASILYSMVSATLAGIAIVVVLVIGYDTLNPILIAAAIGFVLAIPATWVLAKKIVDLR